MKQPNPHKVLPERLTHGAITDIATQMNVLKARLGELHLFRTMHALDEATRALGWEASEKLPTIGESNLKGDRG